MTESWWAKMDLWQSLKSSPQILMFLSADPVTNRVLSEEISMDSTGSLWPYRLPFSFRLSMNSIYSNQGPRFPNFWGKDAVYNLVVPAATNGGAHTDHTTLSMGL